MELVLVLLKKFLYVVDIDIDIVYKYDALNGLILADPFTDYGSFVYRGVTIWLRGVDYTTHDD